MKLRRHVSLYYGSFNLKTCFHVIIGFFINLFYSKKNIYNSLVKTVQKTFNNPVGVYAFTSARGATAAFLNVINSNDKETIISAYTCLAVPTSVIASNSNPVYCDIKNGSLNMDLNLISKKVNKNTNAIIAQHTLGEIINISTLKNKIKDKKVFILEDCALSIGSYANNEFIGSLGDAAVYSLELSKTISTGWGGILVVKNPEIKKKMDKFYNNIRSDSFKNSLRNIIQIFLSGISYNPIFYNFLGKYILYFGYKFKYFKVSTHQTELSGIIGNNFINKLSPIQIYIAKYQWSRLKEISKKSYNNYLDLSKCLSSLGFKYFPIQKNQYIVSPRISFLVSDPDEITKYFYNKGIEIGRWFDGPLSPQPKSNCFKYNKFKYPEASHLSQHVVNLPCHSRLSKVDINLIKKTLIEFSSINSECKIISK